MKGIDLFNGQIGYRFLPKVACTSIKHQLYCQTSLSKDDLGAMDDIHRLLNQGGYHRSIDNCEMRFIVLRDPIKRFLSAYSNRVLHHHELSEWSLAKKHPDLYKKINIFDPDLDTFIENLDEYLQVPSIHHHVKPINSFLGGQDLDYFTHIYKIEELDRLERDLSKALDNEVAFDRLQTGGPKFSLSALNEQQINKLFLFYRDDYKSLAGYYSKLDILKDRGLIEVVDTDHEPDEKQETPFIIWTSRRTGGTNFARALYKSSNLQCIEDEPFNLGRAWGYITKEWKKNFDYVELYKLINQLLSEKWLLKHCLEIADDQINLALSELAVQYGYKSLFLYRETSEDRLLSLNFAQQTAVWGRDQLKQTAISEGVFQQEVDVNYLIEHEKKSRRAMRELYMALILQNQEPLSVSFETLYKTANFEYSCQIVESIFDELGLNKDILTDEFLNKTLKRGGQGTDKDYLRFERADELVEKTKNMGEFKLNSLPEYHKTAVENDAIVHLAIWNPHEAIKPDQAYLSGIILTDDTQNIKFAFYEGDRKIETPGWLTSPAMSKKYPDNSNSGNCRFLAGPVSTLQPIRIEIENTQEPLVTLRFE